MVIPGELRLRVQRAGAFLSGMIVPNIAAFLAWGFITAIFAPGGWLPNTALATLIAPMLLMLLPILIGFSGGRLVYGVRGGVVGAVNDGRDRAITQSITAFWHRSARHKRITMADRSSFCWRRIQDPVLVCWWRSGCAAAAPLDSRRRARSSCIFSAAFTRSTFRTC